MDTKYTQHKALDTPTTLFSRTTTLVDSPASPYPPKASQGPARHWWRISSAFICFFVIGWGDGATGAVMPEMQSHFQLDFAMASMLFVTASAGYALATLLVEPISHLFGRFSIASEHRSPLPALFSSGAVGYSPSKGKHLSIILSGFFHCVYFLFAACAPRYWGVLIAFFIGGIGKSILITQMQATVSFYVTHFDLLPSGNAYWTTNSRVIGISLLHGAYGAGAFFSPLVSQTIRAHGYPWRGFFWISLGLAVLNVAFSLFAFYTTEGEYHMERNLAIASDALSRAKFTGKGDIECPPPKIEKSEEPKGTWHILAMPFVWTVATFLGVFQGAETVAQGFIITFLLHIRNANPNVVGYAASGFWGGLAVGRCAGGFLSTHFSQQGKIYYVNFALLLGIVLHVLIWQIDNMVANSIFVSLLGLLVAPTFPLVLDIATNQNTKQAPGKPSPLPVFSAEEQPTALAIGSSVGAFGGAIFPLAAGVAATKHGAFVVEPLAMASLGFVLLFWVGTQIISKTVRK